MLEGILVGILINLIWSLLVILAKFVWRKFRLRNK